MKKLLSLSVALVLVLALAACGSQPDAPAPGTDAPADSAQTFTLKIGHDQPTDHYYHATAEAFAEMVAEKTDGRVTVDVFPLAQLGSEATMLESLGMGTLDFLITSSSNASVYVPALAALSCCYLFDGEEHVYACAFDEEINDFYRNLCAEGGHGFQLMTLQAGSCRQLYTTFPVDSLSSLQGRKIRVMSAPIESTVWSALGAKPTTVNFGEVYTALQTNLVDGAENTISSYSSAKHYEAAPYLNMTYHQWAITQMWQSDATISALPQDLQDIVMDCAVAACQEGFRYALDVEETMVKDMVADGVTVVEPDTSEFKAVIEPIQAENAESLGCTDVLNRINELRS